MLTSPPRFCVARLACVGWLVSSCLWAGRISEAADTPTETVDFNRDIRPILADTCFRCHGPDASQRQGELRLDVPTGLYGEGDAVGVVVPEQFPDSVLYQRITATDADLRMPPADADRSLSPEQVELIRRWIEQGARWQPHWSLMPPRRVPLPLTENSAWARNPIDLFVLDQLNRLGLRPSSAADKVTWIRRVTLDVTGLPPTLADVDAFLADASPFAHERVVDRLLASPRYGEHMAVAWLDAARYADTSGYQSDGPRSMWRWRDWVIAAFNQNMPFDRFTIEQLAGDLLPAPTLDQRIATGFNRNHRGNAEGGIVPEEYAVEYVVDRVDTTATVWLGLTIACARCHDHKYDPITQREYYQLFAYFNNLPENGRALKEGNSPPYLVAPTDEQQQRLTQLEHELEEAQRDFSRRSEALNAAQAEWERRAIATTLPPWNLADGLIVHYGFDEPRTTQSTTEQDSPGPGANTIIPTAGKVEQAAAFNGQRSFTAGDVARFGYFDAFTLAAWVRPRDTKVGTILSRMTPTDRGDGYAVELRNGHLQVNLVKRWLDDAIRVQTEQSLPTDRWSHLLVSYDGSRVARGIHVYVNGQPQALQIQLDAINQTFANDEPLRIGGGGQPFDGAIDEVRIYDRCLSAEEARVVATPESIDRMISLTFGQRTRGQTDKLRAFYLVHHAPAEIRRFARRLDDARRKLTDFRAALPTVMVMRDRQQAREAFLLVRGQYDRPGEMVSPGVPACLPLLPSKGPGNRLALARWLVDPGNPLTARVAVNRYWQMFFGTGLVETAEDFGVQGQRPSHPQLLDWLAVEFIDSGWDVKAIQRLILTSATYRQSSSRSLAGAQCSPAQGDTGNPGNVAEDLDNRRLSHGPRLRLSAEAIRDQALAISGLLVERIGGPSVKPYQPEGLWREIATDTQYDRSSGGDLYRRSLYTYWKRTVAAPTMMIFDAAGREACTVRRSRTNTPLQALALMNDVTFVEASRVFAVRVLREAGSSPTDRITLAFRLATGRRPTSAEHSLLLAGYKAHRSKYRQHPEAARQFLLSGESDADIAGAELADFAAMTVISSLILNLDEVISKE